MDSLQAKALAGKSTAGKSTAGKSARRQEGLQALKIKEIHPAHRTGW